MQVRLRAYYCPCCGARLETTGGPNVSCAYCAASLEVDVEVVRGQDSPQQTQRPRTQPPASLTQRSGPRFEMSLLSQIGEGEGRGCGDHECFSAVELSGDRFALLYLRVTDKESHTLEWELPVAPLVESLEAYGDPGLAANRALEVMCRSATGFPHVLEVVIAVFDPAASNAVIYTAGCRDAVWWMSSEEGRSVTVGSHHPPLEKKMLREQRDYFSNGQPLYLAAGDLLVVVSAAYCGRGGGPYDSGLGCLSEALNENLGEDPLRVVTLAKNSYWSKRAPAAGPPSGPLRVAAVQALGRTPRDVIVGPFLQQFGSALFEISLLSHTQDWLEMLPLHEERAVLVWASNDGLEVAPETQAQLRERVLQVLDRRDHGDNENPRQAGRYALEGLEQRVTRLAVIQLFDKWGRVKYYRYGWKQPIALGPRTGQDYDTSIQQFDEGGEATVPAGGRLFFPGSQNYPGHPHLLQDWATRWPGGKASRLYMALLDHWKTPPAGPCLTRLAQALVSDLDGQPPTAHLGMALVTGVRKRG